MARIKQLPPRSKVKPADTWDLSSLFAYRRRLGSGLPRLGRPHRRICRVPGQAGRKPRVAGRVPAVRSGSRSGGERLGNYAFLKTAEDVGESKYQRMHGRFMAVASRAAQAASFIRPEILAIPAAKMKAFLACAGAGPLQAAARADPPLQAAHAGQEGREAAGHADRNGPGGQPDLPPAQRRRLEVRRDQERPAASWSS